MPAVRAWGWVWGVYKCPTDCMVCIHTVINRIWSGNADHLDVLDLITLGLNCYASLCAVLGPYRWREHWSTARQTLWEWKWDRTHVLDLVQWFYLFARAFYGNKLKFFHVRHSCTVACSTWEPHHQACKFASDVHLYKNNNNTERPLQNQANAEHQSEQKNS